MRRTLAGWTVPLKLSGTVPIADESRSRDHLPATTSPCRSLIACLAFDESPYLSAIRCGFAADALRQPKFQSSSRLSAVQETSRDLPKAHVPSFVEPVNLGPVAHSSTMLVVGCRPSRAGATFSVPLSRWGSGGRGCEPSQDDETSRQQAAAALASFLTHV